MSTVKAEYLHGGYTGQKLSCVVQGTHIEGRIVDIYHDGSVVLVGLDIGQEFEYPLNIDPEEKVEVEPYA